MDGAAAKPIIDGVAKKAPKSRAGMGKCKAGSNGKWKRGMVLLHKRQQQPRRDGMAKPEKRKNKKAAQNNVGLARAGGAVRRSETFISISDRQLPPGHDPGADYGEAPHGRQRGSRPCNILVESRGYLMPRRDERPR